MRIKQNRRSAFGVHHLHARAEHLADCRLQGDVDGQGQRLAGQRRVTQPGVKGAFHPCGADHLGGIHAFGPKGRPAKHMGRQGPVGVKAHIARAEQQAGVADVMHGLHLLGAEAFAQPQERAPVGKAPFHIGGIHVGEDPRKLLRHTGRVDHLFGMGVKRIGGQVRRQHPAVAVCDIGAQGADFGARRGRARLHRLGRGQKAHPRPDQ